MTDSMGFIPKALLGKVLLNFHSTCAHLTVLYYSVTIQVFSVVYFFLTNSLNAFGYFAPTIISAMGFTGWKSQLLTVPPNVVGFIVIIGERWSPMHPSLKHSSSSPADTDRSL